MKKTLKKYKYIDRMICTIVKIAFNGPLPIRRCIHRPAGTIGSTTDTILPGWVDGHNHGWWHPAVNGGGAILSIDLHPAGG